MKRTMGLLFGVFLALVLVFLPLTALAQRDTTDEAATEETTLEQELARAAEQMGPALPERSVFSPAFTQEVQYPLFVGVDDTTVPAYQIDPATNDTVPAFSGFQVWGAAYDPVNDRVFFNNGSTLYEWPRGGSVNTLGTIVDAGMATQAMVGLAYHNGVLYGTKNIANEAVYRINPNSLLATVYIDYVDDEYDFGGVAAHPVTGALYGTNDDSTPHGSGLFRINLDGSATLIAPYPDAQTDIDGLAVSHDGYAYLIPDEPGSIYVYDLNGGAYVTPLTNPWTTSEVFSAGAWIYESSLAVTKTVGTDPLACAVTDEITVEMGTDVTYCYTVENTGDVTFSTHTLVDSEEGTLLNGFPYSLAPGASAFLTQTVTLIETITNTATWAASNAGTSYAYDDAAPYSFTDIGATGTPLDLSDEGEANVTLPFTFSYFGTLSNQVRVGNNGGIRFATTTGDVAPANTALPSAAHPLTIFPYWDDLDDETGNVYVETVGSAPNRIFIVQWDQRAHNPGPGAGQVTFQAYLYEGTNEILFQYIDLDFGDPALNYGASATVGLNKDGVDAVQVSYDTAVLTDGQAILWKPTNIEFASDTATVNVLIPEITVSPAVITETLAEGLARSYPLTISNNGPGILNWNIDEAPSEGATGSGVPSEVKIPAAPQSNQAAHPNESLDYYFAHGLSGTPAGSVASRIAPRSAAVDGIIYYGDRAYFDADAPGLPVEDFEDGLWGDGAILGCPAPFDATTNNACFAPGGILPGIRFQDNPLNDAGGGSTNGLVGIGPGVFGSTGKSIIANTFVDSFEIVFDPPVDAAGMDLVHYFADGATVDIALYDASDVLLDATTATASNAGSFWGVYSTTPIGRITILSQLSIGDGAEGVDNIAFGVAATPVCSFPEDIPWLSLSETGGMTAAGESSMVLVGIDTTGLVLGDTYRATLCVNSNDPVNWLIKVPVEVTVDANRYVYLPIMFKPGAP